MFIQTYKRHFTGMCYGLCDTIMEIQMLCYIKTLRKQKFSFLIKGKEPLWGSNRIYIDIYLLIILKKHWSTH